MTAGAMSGGVGRVAACAALVLVAFTTASAAAPSLADEQRALAQARAQADQARRRSEALERRAAGA
ncbi:MAG: metalloendopeptidase, partial [Sphingobium sp.]